jgi:ABC-type glutathione transport system ATPase component
MTTWCAVVTDLRPPDATASSRPALAADILTIEGLRGGFTSRSGQRQEVLRGVSFAVRRGELSAIVGETGSGKTLTVLAVVGLTPPGFERTAGAIMFEGSDLAGYDERQLRQIRGPGIAMVFQNSRSALNPVFTVGTQLGDVFRLHRGLTKNAALKATEDMLARVRISEPRSRVRQYPHELSGGTVQRVQLAMALACQPSLLILDEPTTGLDVTIQADILELIVELNHDLGMSTVMITHDLGVVAETCDHVIVMRDGLVCETGACEQVIARPAHEYTRQLLEASRVRASRP